MGDVVAESTPIHGVDGWDLFDYEWFDDSGDALFIYRRMLADGTRERAEVRRPQPTGPWHKGWRPA